MADQIISSGAGMNCIPVIDLFSGPGGLAEGFAAVRDSSGSPKFPILLSIEMDASAYHTLRLRSFLRKFPTHFPSEYYEYVNGFVSEEPDWVKLYPEKWKTACEETLCQKLGTRETASLMRKRIQKIRKVYGNRTILLGGPPCQSYSVAGRSRNAGNAHYDSNDDERQSLYREFAKVLGQLQPAIAVMENVRGMLSARHRDRQVFPEIMETLQHAGGRYQYRLFALATSSESLSWDEGLSPNCFLVRAEDYGIPQTRHRVFVICVRCDIVDALPRECLPRLEPSKTTVSLHDVIGLMPKLRSRLSKRDDATSWQKSLVNAYDVIQNNLPEMEQYQTSNFKQALDCALQSAQGDAPAYRNAKGGMIDIANSCPTKLREWITDSNISRLPNNETRGHIKEDIMRYLYATAFALTFDRSPKTFDFPEALAPKHLSWNSGTFVDRFRVQLRDQPSTTITSHISKDGHYFIHPDPSQCRSLTVREAARLQTFPDNYFFHGKRTQQYVQVGNAVPPYLALQIAESVQRMLDLYDLTGKKSYSKPWSLNTST